MIYLLKISCCNCACIGLEMVASTMGFQLSMVLQNQRFAEPFISKCGGPMTLVVLLKSFLRWVDSPVYSSCVNGTILKIDATSLHEEAYVDPCHSLNVMIICRPDYTFYGVNASWPGSVHDSRVLRNSAISQRFDNGWRAFPDAVILG